MRPRQASSLDRAARRHRRTRRRRCSTGSAPFSVADAPPQRIDEQRRPQHRTADADMQNAGDIAERPGLDRIDQRPHALPSRGGKIHFIGRAAAALGDMGRSPALARIDDSPGEQCFARLGEPHRLARAMNSLDHAPVEMGLGPVEIDARRLRSVSRLRRSGSAANSSSSRLVSLASSPPHIVAAPPFATPA